MVRRRFPLGGSGLGWIANTDACLFFLLFLFLTTSVAFAGLVGAEEENHWLKKVYEDLTKTLTTLTARVDSNEAKIDDLKVYLAKTKEQTIKNRQDIANNSAAISLNSLCINENSVLISKTRNLVADNAKSIKNNISDIDVNKAEVKKIHSLVAGNEKSIQDNSSSINSNKVEIKNNNSTIESVQNKLLIVIEELRKLQEELDEIRDGEKKLRQELLGLNSLDGELNRVVFVVDKSLSMSFAPGKGREQKPSIDPQNQRWVYAKNKITLWLKLLPVKNVAIVTFAENATAYPDSQTYFKNSRDKDWEMQLSELMKKLEEGTNTLDAIRKACQYSDANAIILFTDGSPTSSPNGTESQADIQTELRTELREIVEKRKLEGKKPIPINVVGLGDYFNPEFGLLLKDIAKMTEGAFLGQ